MPVYCYKCPKCAHARTMIRRIAERNNLPWCDACAPPLDAAHVPMENFFLMERDITAEQVNSDNMDYDRPVFSDSMGVTPRQVNAAQAKHPWIKYQPDGRIRIDSHAEYRQVRKALGFADTSKR